MSAVRTYFKISSCKADCKLCGVKVSQGRAKPSSFGTSNLIEHLKSKHDAEYKEFSAASSSSSTKRLTLEETVEKARIAIKIKYTVGPNNRSSCTTYCI